MGFTFEYPLFPGLKPHACCQATMKQIDEKVQLGNLLHMALGSGAWFGLTFSDPIEYIYNFDRETCDLFAKSMLGVPQIVKARCLSLIAMECLDHPGGDLQAFWQEMHRTFSMKKVPQVG